MSGLPSWTIHAASDKRCTARGLESSGNIAWAITGSSARSKTIVWWFWSCASEIARKSIASALPETVQVIQLQEKTPTARSWWTVERGGIIEQQTHRAWGMGKTLLSTKAAAKASACRISSSASWVLVFERLD